MHFWNSKKAREMAESGMKEIDTIIVSVEVKRYRNYAKLDTGEIVRYDIASKTMEHGVVFDDLVYIGTGAFHHSEKM